MHISDDGVVIRDIKRDEDRIITILTRKNGVITAFANNARKPRSSLASATELLCYSSFVLFSNRDRVVVNNADTIHSFFNLRQDVEVLALACWFAQLMAELAPQLDEANDYIDLLLLALHNLEITKRPPDLLKPALELRTLTLAGYMPDLVACSVCSQNKPNQMYFSMDGFIICANCMENATSFYKSVLIPDSVLAAMRHIIYAEPKRVFAFSLSGANLKILYRITENFMLHQVEKTFTALEFYRSLKQGATSLKE